MERELHVLKTEEKVRNQKLDDLQYDYDALKEDLQYYKGYSQEADATLLEAKEKLRQQKKKIQSLKETMGVALSGSEGEAEEEEVFQKVFNKGVEEEEEEKEESKEEKKESTRKPKPLETEEEEKPPSSQGENPEVNEFTQLGYVWEFNREDPGVPSSTRRQEGVRTDQGSTDQRTDALEQSDRLLPQARSLVLRRQGPRRVPHQEGQRAHRRGSEPTT